MNCHSNRPVSSLREDAVCIGNVFSQAGYNCAYIGKYHADYPTPNDPDRPGKYVDDTHPVWDAYTPPGIRRHGFDYWYSYGTFDVHKHPHYWDTQGIRHDIDEWSPKHETDKAIAYLQNKNNERDAKRPFFMMISYNPPHTPYHSLDDCMEEDFNLYKNISVDSLLVRPNVDRKMQKTSSVRYYFASISGIDREFGRILDELKKMGIDKNTIVVFTSDHGETMCSQGVESPKNLPYAESMNVPFMVRYPQKISHRVDTTLLLSTPDIMPTILGLCGLEKNIPPAVEGRNYAKWLISEDMEIPIRDAALYLQNIEGEIDKDGKAISYFPITRGIKTHQYTMSLTIDRNTKTLTELLLFDDWKDPYQMHRLLLNDNREIVRNLCKKMATLLKEADDPWFKNLILNDLIPYE
jgi:arylsulfatase A-like enzyme